jgi:Glucose-6-phosphate dehydrogenase, NAD binding domain
MNAPASDAFVLFGATGDLAYKKIFPALQALIRAGDLDIPIIGMARAEWTLDKLRERARYSLDNNGGVDTDAFATVGATAIHRRRLQRSGNLRAPQKKTWAPPPGRCTCDVLPSERGANIDVPRHNRRSMEHARKAPHDDEIEVSVAESLEEPVELRHGVSGPLVPFRARDRERPGAGLKIEACADQTEVEARALRDFGGGGELGACGSGPF